jgi:hypothetical protein
VVNKGNGSDSHSLGCIHSLQVALCLVSEEWPKVGNGPGSTIRDMHSLGQIHSLQVTLCLVLEEWNRVMNGLGSKIRTIILPCLKKNKEDSRSTLMFYSEGRYSFRCE